MKTLMLLLSVSLLAACASQSPRTAQQDELGWRSDSAVLPEQSSRYALPRTLPEGSEVSLRAPRKSLEIEGADVERQITTLRLYTDANGLPLLEVPKDPFASADDVEEAIEALGWDIRRVNMDENRIEIDGSPWLSRRSDQLFPSRPVIEIYFFALGNGTQVHMERQGDEQSFPVSTQRELLEALYAELS